MSKLDIPYDRSAADSTLFPTDRQNALCFFVQPRPDVTAQERKQLFWQLQCHLRTRGLVMAELLTCCIVIGVHRALEPADRHAAVDWLIDQPQVGEILLGNLCDAQALHDGGFPVYFDGIEGEPPLALRQSGYRLLRHLVERARVRALQALLAEGGQRVPPLGGQA
jgi:hypothetical protein